MSRPATARWSINGRFLTQPQTGVQRYAGEITKAIDEWLVADEAFSRRMAWEIVVPADCRIVPSYEAIQVRQSRRGKGYAWEQLVLPAMAPDGIASFANLGPLTRRRQILCLHDANVLLEPSSYSTSFRLAYRVLLPLLARRVRAVSTVSNFSADMLDEFGVTARRTRHVVHNGHEHALRWSAARSKFAAPGSFKRPFVFALGSRAKHKQIDLLMGLAPALDAMGIDIVISGGTSSIFAETAVAVAPNVIAAGFVSDDDLAALFGQALCFAFPSRTEGFGIPLLEAMVHGAPIVTSDCASMPEVCADAALYAPPDDPARWLEQIGRLAKDPSLRETLKQRGAARFPRFSWRTSARSYLDLALALSTAGSTTPNAATSDSLRRSAT
jgi:Glycosyltransferase